MKYWSWYCKQNDVGTDLLPQDQSQNVSIQAQKFLTRWWWKGLSWPPNLSDQFLVNLVKLGFSSQKCTTLGGQIQPLSGDHLLCPPFDPPLLEQQPCSGAVSQSQLSVWNDSIVIGQAMFAIMFWYTLWIPMFLLYSPIFSRASIFGLHICWKCVYASGGGSGDAGNWGYNVQQQQLAIYKCTSPPFCANGTSTIHSKSEKVCGTAFSVKKNCGKSA